MYKNAAVFLAMRAIVVSGVHNGGGWKKDDAGNLVVDGTGNPIWVDANGGEKALEANAIARLNSEAKTLRTRAEEAEGALSKYKGPDGKPIDPAKAIDTVSKLDAKQLIEAGEVDKVREQVAQQYVGQINELKSGNEQLSSQITNMRIDSVFQGSDFLRDNIAIPRDFVEAALRSNFKTNDKGEVLAYDKSGNPLMSKKNAGEYASGDEALQLLIDMHPQKDTILRAQPQGGSGNQGHGGNGGRGNVISRKQFDALDQQGRADAAAAMQKGELKIAD